MKTAQLLSVALLVALFPSAAWAEPSGFEIQIGYSHQNWRTYVMEHVPGTLQLRALDAEGNIDRSYSGTVTVDPGLFVLREDGREEPLLQVGPFVNGLAVERFVLVRTNTIRVSDGAAEGRAAVEPLDTSGWVSLLPALVAILLCVITRQVFVSLFLGVLVGGVFLWGGVWPALLHTFSDMIPFVAGKNIKILMWTFALGGLVALMARSGGTAGLVKLIAPLARTRRSGQIATWLMGLAVFFDDYANCYIVGPTMRARTDLLKISREKLAYIVDSTAAPIASIMVISTWVGVEIEYIEDALSLVGVEGAGVGMETFWATIPYRFYPLLALVMVFLVAYTRRDFGPMLEAERRAAETGMVLGENASPMADKELTEMTEQANVSPRWYNAVIPLAVLVGMVLFFVVYNVAYQRGWLTNPAWGPFDSEDSFLWATIVSCLVSAALILAQKLMTTEEVLRCWLGGAKSMLMAVFILCLAWSIGQMCKDLHTGDYVVSLTQGILSPNLVPVLTFLLSAVISFSTGTSYGTMAIMMPITVPLAYALTGSAGLGEAEAALIHIGTIGSVLAGSVFGDHCSPISDTTIMSSMGSASDHMDHVKTQIPYALLCGGISALGCLAVGYGLSPWLVLLGGVGALLAALRFFGKVVA